jgi:hypothetical protein
MVLFIVKAPYEYSKTWRPLLVHVSDEEDDDKTEETNGLYVYMKLIMIS